MNDSVVRFGVVGVGSISLRGILPHLTQEDVQDRVRITALVDPVPGRARAAAEKFGIEHAFESYEAMLEAEVCDAVSIASPIGLHFEQGRMAVERGLHCHFNKTMTTTAAEADELIGLAGQKNVRLVASPGQMLHPLNQEIRRRILRGDLGTLTWAVTGATFGEYHQNEKIRQGDDVLSNINPAWYFRRPGGGPLYDVTVYGMHTLTGILGPAKRVTAMSGVRIPEREFRGQTLPVDIDDNTFFLMDFGDSLFGFAYGAAAGGLPVFAQAMIFGTKGTIHGPNLNGKPIEYPGKDLVDAEGRHAVLPHVTGPHREIEESHVFEDIMQLVDWIREDKPSIVTAEHARHVIEIYDAAYQSAETGRAIDLKSTFQPLEV